MHTYTSTIFLFYVKHFYYSDYTDIYTHPHSDTQTHLPACAYSDTAPSVVYVGSVDLTFSSLWAAGCRALLGQHTPAHPYQQIGNTCRADSVLQCACTSRKNSEARVCVCGLLCVGRITLGEYLELVQSWLCYSAKSIP